MDYLCGAKAITRILSKWKREPEEEVWGGHNHLLSLAWEMQEGATSQEMQPASSSWKRQGEILSRASSKGDSLLIP